MTEDRRWVDAHRFNVFIETAGALADEAINALSPEKHELVLGHLAARTGLLGLSMTFDPFQLRIVVQDKDGKVLIDVGRLTFVENRPQFMN